ncbi:MAG TPA: hypothetical protein PK079_04995 [Leptospiraceae bacterium]|nr:hypothetical protein [Leptospiraceae bacterium]HMW06227.1 hypothetical protein [Leptospiraceae bacterium]HMX34429.1 hypothetical protein [Leptospiraceae bacterium]HMY31689.1 hypothetical protein [Leptospiraceae bacterium]HMZ67482.1 hypothetical protein [Leptospiraceae bacterium]
MKLTHIIRYIVGILILVNCAVPATREGMTYKNFEPRKKIKESIYIDQSVGGSETNPFLVSKIANEEFTNAIQDSIKESDLFHVVDEKKENVWLLKSEIINQDQPYFSFSTNCKVLVKYSLYKSNTLVKEFQIEETASASLSDSLRPIKRVQLANEKAGRANINKLLQELEKI